MSKITINGKEFKSWDDLDREVNILSTYVDDRRHEVGDEVVAIDDYRIDKIIIYPGHKLKLVLKVGQAQIEEELEF